jgi:PPOX class probable F420-dependent enzyme
MICRSIMDLSCPVRFAETLPHTLVGVQKLDESTPEGAAAGGRLRTELMAWITTVRADGQPQSSAVWFHWDGTDLVVLSQPTAAKLTNLAGNPRLAFHLDGDGLGDGLAIADGTAEVLPDGPGQDRLDAYAAKYDTHLRERMQWDPAKMLASYTTAVRITPTRWRIS